MLSGYFPAMRIDSMPCGQWPVSNAARDGMHHEPRYAPVKRTPLAASASIFGVFTHGHASG